MINDEFRTFFADHRWSDQRGSRTLAEMVDLAWINPEFDGNIVNVKFGNMELADFEGHHRHQAKLADLRMIFSGRKLA
jgi:hypothetical protein